MNNLYSRQEGRLVLTAIVGCQSTSQHTDECGFSCSVLPQHNDDLGVGELALVDIQLEFPWKKRTRACKKLQTQHCKITICLPST